MSRKNRTTPSSSPDNPRRLGTIALLNTSGGRPYAIAIAIDALAAGLLRPFLLLYGIVILNLSIPIAGFALSVGMVAGLAGVPLVGRWIDKGGRTAPVVATLMIRAAGTGVLLLARDAPSFICAAVVIGVGNQSWPSAHAAVVSALSTTETRAGALAAGHALRNAGLGAGALIATVAVSGGTGALRVLAAVTILGYVVASLLVSSVRIQRPAIARRPGRVQVATSPHDRKAMRLIHILAIANIPFGFCYDVLEVALPVVLVTTLHAPPYWSSGVFVGNTVLVILLQVVVVTRVSRRSRRSALAVSGLVLAASYLGFWFAGSLGDGLGPVGIAAISILYTFGEILYTGMGTALVLDIAPTHLVGRALARWQLSTGLSKAIAPAAITSLLAFGHGTLWIALAGATVTGALVVRFGARSGRSAKGDGSGEVCRESGQSASVTTDGS